MHAPISPTIAKVGPCSVKCELRYIDGSRWIATWFERALDRQWSWAVEKACEEFDCQPDDVSCIDHMTDADDYEGPDAGRDKIAVNGKAVGYFA